MEFDHVASALNDVDKSKIFADVGFVGAAVSIVKPFEQVHEFAEIFELLYVMTHT